MAKESQGGDIAKYLKSSEVVRQLAEVLPNGLTPHRVIRCCITLVRKNPDLAACSQVSILSGLIQASELGLELSGPLGHAYLVPRKAKGGGMEAVFQVGYKGYLELIHRSGKVAVVHPRVVHRKDRFEVRYGTSPCLVHEPYLGEGDPGEPTWYYVAVQLASGHWDYEVMSKAQVEEHRRKYVAGGSKAWQTSYDTMAVKTVIRRIAARLPMAVEVQEAAGRDEEGLLALLDQSAATTGTGGDKPRLSVSDRLADRLLPDRSSPPEDPVVAADADAEWDEDEGGDEEGSPPEGGTPPPTQGR